MKKRIAATLLIVAFTASSCLIRNAENFFRRSDVVCAEHNKRLKPVVVLIDYGFGGWPNRDNPYGPPYLKRRYSGGCVVRLQKFAVVYHCPKCEREHRRENK